MMDINENWFIISYSTPMSCLYLFHDLSGLRKDASLKCMTLKWCSDSFTILYFNLNSVHSPSSTNGLGADTKVQIHSIPSTYFSMLVIIIAQY